MAPHSLTLTMVGASLLWVGWFGFNAGSNLEPTAMPVWPCSTPSWPPRPPASPGRWRNGCMKGKPSLLGAASGVVAGLVAITPAAGFAGPMGAIVLGLIVSPICLFFVSVVKNAPGL